VSTVADVVVLVLLVAVFVAVGSSIAGLRHWR